MKLIGFRPFMTNGPTILLSSGEMKKMFLKKMAEWLNPKYGK